MHRQPTALGRFISRANTDGPIPDNRPELGPCWLWMGALNNKGYGFFQRGERKMGAHRAAYELFVGPIPEGMVIDHLCRLRHCVNPAHLEPVTNSVNLLRGEGPTQLVARERAKTHCKHGHEFTLENTYWNPSTGRRQCRTCVRTVYKSTRHA